MYIQDYFVYLQAHGLYKSDVLEDCIIFLFIFIPILRYKINIYIET
jgi:hypothetical protein